MKPMPIPVTTIRKVIKIITCSAQHGRKFLHLAIPVAIAVAEAVQEFRRKN